MTVRRTLVAVAAVVALVVAVAGGWLIYLDHQVSSVDRIDLHLGDSRRPSPDPVNPSTHTRPTNILIAGADAGTPSIAQEVASGHWTPGSHRSDTIMVLHLTADRKHAYLVSIPRDSWVHIDGYGMAKVNAAFSLGGPDLYVHTIEHLTGLRMDHLAIIDWAGFKDITTALGGVDVYIPHTVHDDAQHITWTAGEHELSGAEALHYVRTRHGLPSGDFDRIKRQQNFMRQTMQQLMSAGTLYNPFRLTAVLKAITSNLTVDSGLTNAGIRGLAQSLRHLSASDVTFVTIPTTCCPYIDGQSTVSVRFAQMHALMRAVSHDDIEAYFAKYGRADTLGGPHDVN